MWQDRRVSTGVKPASWFEANEKNFRMHPRSQADSFVSVANIVGLVGAIKVNLRSGDEWGNLKNQPIVFDGHMRIMEALKLGDDTPLPVDYYDLTPDEEKLVLLTFDYMSKMAGIDQMQFSDLFEEVSKNIEELKNDSLEKLLEQMARENGIFLDDLEDSSDDVSGDGDDSPKEKSDKARIVVLCDPDDAEEIIRILNTFDNCEWQRKE